MSDDCIKVMVANAGIVIPKTLIETELSEFNLVTNVWTRNRDFGEHCHD